MFAQTTYEDMFAATSATSTIEKQFGSLPASEVKITVLGPAGSGKTALIRRLTENVFLAEESNNASTRFNNASTRFKGVHTTTTMVDGDKVRLIVREQRPDSAEEAEARFSTTSSFQALIVTYDVCDNKSFRLAKSIVNSIRRLPQEAIRTAVLVGCKAELNGERTVRPKTAARFARSKRMTLACETSAKTGENVQELFNAIAKECVQANIQPHRGYLATLMDPKLRVAPHLTRSFKIVMLGASLVGKTSVTQRFAYGTTANNNSTDIASAVATFVRKPVSVRDTTVNLDIWDTPGCDQRQAAIPIYSRNANAAIIMFDVTRPDTFAIAQSWPHLLEWQAEEDMLMVLVGNKADRKQHRMVAAEEVQSFAAANRLVYMETSSSDGHSVEALFHAVADALYTWKVSPPGIDKFTFQLTSELENKAKRSQRFGCHCVVS